MEGSSNLQPHHRDEPAQCESSLDDEEDEDLQLTFGHKESPILWSMCQSDKPSPRQTPDCEATPHPNGAVEICSAPRIATSLRTSDRLANSAAPSHKQKDSCSHRTNSSPSPHSPRELNLPDSLPLDLPQIAATSSEAAEQQSLRAPSPQTAKLRDVPDVQMQPDDVPVRDGSNNASQTPKALPNIAGHASQNTQSPRQLPDNADSHLLQMERARDDTRVTGPPVLTKQLQDEQELGGEAQQQGTQLHDKHELGGDAEASTRRIASPQIAEQDEAMDYAREEHTSELLDLVLPDDATGLDFVETQERAMQNGLLPIDGQVNVNLSTTLTGTRNSHGDIIPDSDDE